MTLHDILQNTSGYSWAGIIVVLSLLVEVSPIKINPVRWLGNLLLGGIRGDIQSIRNDLENHIAEDMRRTILDFQNSCLNHRKHTREEFTYIYKLCDKYEKYIERTGIPNSEAEDAINYIRHVYRECLDKGAFLLPQERSDEDVKEP